MIRSEQLTTVYGHGDSAVTVLDRLDFRIDAGKIFAVVGPSGAGKRVAELLDRTAATLRIRREGPSSMP